ncbi:GntR family transcriptional regulator [Burkholderia sp. PAMC 26561]|uniref:GntR family transcriptional regulator n=1 Tax=Burkholderia sp. PAMC 26561 TaxID=1795043 RepID=UPI000A7D7742|nr:winged helix-turn-helix domain-containing protein [Burkholderia sp. PAMC 26561]
MLRDWKVQVSVNREKVTPLTVQITQAVVDKIRSGLLRPGEALPGSRELAAKLGINRKTVIAAYDELISHGWLVVEGKRGTFVSPKLPDIEVEQRSRSMRKAGGRPDFLVRTTPSTGSKGSCQNPHRKERLSLPTGFPTHALSSSTPFRRHSG